MALSYRKRGEVWHARGTVRVGRETYSVREFSTGCTGRADAEACGAAEEARIRAEALDGPAGRARRLTVAEMLAAYVNRQGGIAAQDEQRITALNEGIGGRLLAEAPAAWREWMAQHPASSAGTLARYRNTLNAALRYGAEAHATTAPRLPPVRLARDAGLSVPILSPAEAERLLAAYNPHAWAPVVLLADMGLRTQEALQLDWREVDCERAELRIGAARTKSGRGRAVPMTHRVEVLLRWMWEAQARPVAGHVFFSSKGEPYRDTRGQGGNPLAQAHATALAAARISLPRFRVHDWRHNWAAGRIMAGVDLFTIMRLGGWASLRMVEQRYGAVTAQHMREAVRKRA
ncbi:XerC Integrase [uncultured Caudovirales phage]|uniref:Integrase n=1 Tax=uncultured Caudovirales phage TaxID=2100421 RepID=A0A6J5L1I3_9CAUD|nr:XerC Integrase [uncultured Caudovirales phage]